MFASKYLNVLKRVDWLLLVPVLLLVVYGLSALYSQTLNVENPDMTLFNKQLTFFIIGILCLIGIMSIDYRLLETYGLLIYLFSIATMIAVLLVGTTIRGTRGWFYILGLGLQPAEFAKFGLVLGLAYLYARRKESRDRPATIGLALAMSCLPAGLAILQPDFGAAIVLLGIGLAFFTLFSLRKKHILILLTLCVLLGIILWNYVLLDYQKERVNNFFHPTSDPLGQGYNVRQSIIAVGSGQLFGRGLGLGTQSQLQFLPETETDFIFAAIAEALGFVGAMLMFLFFSALFGRILYLMKNARDAFSLNIFFGFGFIFFFQTFINIGMNMGMLPVTGLSLPFVSYGGSFLLICILAVGLMESASIRRKLI